MRVKFHWVRSLAEFVLVEDEANTRVGASHPRMHEGQPTALEWTPSAPKPFMGLIKSLLLRTKLIVVDTG